MKALAAFRIIVLTIVVVAISGANIFAVLTTHGPPVTPAYADAASSWCKAHQSKQTSSCERGYRGAQSGSGHPCTDQSGNAPSGVNLNACQAGAKQATAGTPSSASTTTFGQPPKDCNGGGVPVSDALAPPGSGRCIGGNGQNPIFALLNVFIKFASAILGIVLVLMIVIAGLQYVMSDGSPDTTREAKDRIRNAVTGLVLYAIMYGALALILPGGIFR